MMKAPEPSRSTQPRSSSRQDTRQDTLATIDQWLKEIDTALSERCADHDNPAPDYPI